MLLRGKWKTKRDFKSIAWNEFFVIPALFSVCAFDVTHMCTSQDNCSPISRGDRSRFNFRKCSPSLSHYCVRGTHSTKETPCQWDGMGAKETKFVFAVFGPKPFPICFKLLRKVNILANLSERFIGGPKCNLLGDWLNFNSFGSSLQKGPHCYHLPGQRLHFLPSINLAGHVSVFRC